MREYTHKILFYVAFLCTFLRVDHITVTGNAIADMYNKESDAIRNQLYWRHNTVFAEM